ncbi:MAG: hypothetical protein IT162_04240 [Bryobacterales bacterium]|nr:hypothetical protein [Bryobacterales bacterium]
MMMRRAGLWLAVAALAAPGEVLDCVVATVGRQAITRSAVDEQLRIAAFLNGEAAPDTSVEAKRRTLERLIDVALIRREMEISRYVAPAASAAPKLTYDAKQLAARGLDEAAVKRHLELQAQTLSFVELRFRPGSSVTDGEMELYYREKYLPDWQRANAGKTASPPELDDVRDRIEAVLLEQRIDQAMEAWLQEARRQVRVRYVAAEACGWE